MSVGSAKVFAAGGRFLSVATLQVVWLGVAGAGGAAWAAEPQRLEFEVLLDAKPIGTHRYEVVTADDGSQTVTSKASFDVKLLGFVVYRYRHQAQERWREGCLANIDSTTDDNGAKVTVSGHASTGGFEVVRPRPLVRSGCIRGYAYWNPAWLLNQMQLLNPQTGEFDASSMTLVGRESVNRSGASIPANHYRLLGGKLVIDLWYSDGGEWLQLESPARGSQRLVYRRL